LENKIRVSQALWNQFTERWTSEATYLVRLMLLVE